MHHGYSSSWYFVRRLCLIISNHQQQNHQVDRIIQVKSLSIYHKDKTLISSLSLEVERYSFHCIVGESGSGKSLLVRSILHMTDDQLTYQGNVDIDLLHADAMFQDANSNLFQNITIKQHIAMLYDAKINTITSRTISRGKTMMTRLGLEQPEQLLQYYPFELSGGMAQRVAFILSLIRNPQCLILDEPTSALMCKIVLSLCSS